MAVSAVSASNSVDKAPQRRVKIQDQILEKAKSSNGNSAPAQATPEASAREATKSEEKPKRMSIQNELLTYGAQGKTRTGLAKAEQPAAPASESKQAEAPKVETQAPEPKKRMSIQDEIIASLKAKKEEKETPTAVDATA